MTTNKILSILFALLLLFGCDYNDKYFEGYDDDVNPTDVKKIEYTLTDADYKTIADNNDNKEIAKANGDSDALSKLTANKYFAEPINAEIYAPAFLAGKWFTADNGSAVKLTYNKLLDNPEYLVSLGSAENYTVSDNDYAGIWGDVEANYFTPAKPLNRSANKILTAAYPEAESGDIKVLQYNYSITEPNTGGGTLEIKEINEDFDYLTEADKNKKTEIEGWLNIAVNGDKYWVNNYYNGGYIQCSAYGATGDVASWLVSPKINLSASTAPKLAFDVCLGYPNGAELRILISEDFNGKDVTNATWVDITAHFAFDDSNSRYGTISPAGVYDMSSYKTTPFYLAFKYVGNAEKSTTFQIDNIQLGDNVDIVVSDVVKEDFEGETITYQNQVTKGAKTWELKEFSGNKYYQFSARSTTEEQECYLVSPKISIPALTEGVPELLFDLCVGYWNANVLSVLVSTDYTGDAEVATWKDLTSDFNIPEGPSSSYGVFGPAGAAPLNGYAGKDIYVAFKYIGDGTDARTTTIQLDNIRVSLLAHGPKSRAFKSSRSVSGGINELTAIYTFDGGNWASYSDAIAVSPSDYEEMGFETFSSSNLPVNYLPQFLAKTNPYAQEGQTIGVVYTYNSVQEAAEYIYSTGLWAKTAITEVVTDQFVKSGNKWNFDPSVTIILKPGRSQPDVSLYYQAIVDAVGKMPEAGIDYFQTSPNPPGYYTNAEFYYGASSYQNNMSFRISDWRTGNKAGTEGAYADYDDTALEALMHERIKEAFIPALKALHGDMIPVSGVDVLCTINFGIYVGTTISECTHQIQYKVIGAGQFEFVEDSFQPLIK